MKLNFIKIGIIILLVLAIFLSRQTLLYYYYAYTAKSIEKEIAMTKEFLKSTIIDEKPRDYIRQYFLSYKDYSESFYYFKIWFKENNILLKDIANSYPKTFFKDKNRIGLDLYYSKEQPNIQSVLVFKNGNYKIRSIHFSLNNCMFTADKNKDNKIDRNDLLFILEDKN